MLAKSTLGLVAILAASATIANTALAQQKLAVRSDDMRDVFVTAGYAAAFGAATGVALLPFMPGSVSDNMRVVAGGASIGFLLGSALSLYNISANIHAANSRNQNNGYAPEDETIYGNNENVDGEPLSSVPANCQGTYGALVVGCGNRLSFSWPDVRIAPNSVSVPLVNVRF